MAIKTINRVEVTPKKATKKDFRFVLRKFKLENGKYFTLEDINGEETTYTLSGPTVFDMTDKFQKAVVEGLKVHPVYKKHLNFIDHKEKAEASVSNSQQKAKAFQVIQEMQKTRRSFARALGMRVDGLQDVEVHSMLLALADKNPDPARPGIDALAGYDRILNLYNDPTASARMLLTDGKRVGVFKVRGQVWYFNDMPMGNSTEQALEWVQENEDIVAGIKKDVATKLKALEG